MKIIYLHQYFNTPSMSGGTRSYEMARRFIIAGHEVHMITSQRENSRYFYRWMEENIDGIHVYWLHVPYSNKMRFTARIMAFMKFALLSALKAVKVGGDIIFATSTPLTIALPAVYAARRLKKPMVFEVRDLWPEIPIAVGAIKNIFLKKATRWFECFAYKNSEAIVALSPGMAAGIIKTGYPENKVYVVPNSCDIEMFQISESERDAFLRLHPDLRDGPLVLYAGTLGLINGVGYLVEIATAMIRIDASVRFLIVGEGKEQKKIREKAFSAGVLGKNLWMLPSVSKSEMPHLLSAATITSSFVINLKELWNNSANKFFDALAAGRPIMINYGGWQADLIRETGAGLVVPPNDALRSAEILHDFLSEPGRVTRAGQAAFKLAKSRFARDDLAEELLAVLEKTCG
ncbi:MAG: glycosyltransferase family 4 protein [Deltaproteobacteria bacterium]|nr:glycosyltransferase family 4 protein [Deltaproteobacteria bacterium]